ncbi:MAG: hypothetical protein GXO92_05470 [FCB group bacterium]|nr:hypothetical protein [FCB group bacterium]
MIAVKVDKISFHPPSRSYAVILKEISGIRKLPVIVGAYEAQSIALALEYMETPRPLTHDLIGSIIRQIEGKLVAVKITELIDGVFYSRMELRGKLIGKRSIDARPSDAIAVALRMNTPILVADQVMDEASVVEEIPKETPVEALRKEPTREKLESQLQAAIEAEEYEKAAILRDKIKELKELKS